MCTTSNAFAYRKKLNIDIINYCSLVWINALAYPEGGGRMGRGGGFKPLPQ